MSTRRRRLGGENMDESYNKLYAVIGDQPVYYSDLKEAAPSLQNPNTTVANVVTAGSLDNNMLYFKINQDNFLLTFDQGVATLKFDFNTDLKNLKYGKAKSPCRNFGEAFCKLFENRNVLEYSIYKPSYYANMYFMRGHTRKEASQFFFDKVLTDGVVTAPWDRT
jgi:hypothetical protein